MVGVMSEIIGGCYLPALGLAVPMKNLVCGFFPLEIARLADGDVVRCGNLQVVDDQTAADIETEHGVLEFPVNVSEVVVTLQ